MVSRIDFIESGKNFQACQWVQEEKGKLKILIVPGKGFTESDRNYIIEETLKRVGKDNLDIETETVPIEKLIYTDRGKFKLIVNKLNIQKSNNIHE